ncbi:hypothetical protein GCM10020258_32790 [Sphingomonas yabuuchiae]
MWETGEMTRIGIVGAGQAGLQLGMGLLERGHEVIMLSNQTAEQIAGGRVTSSQCMFDQAREHERKLGINFWDEACPPVEGIAFSLVGEDGTSQMSWASRLDAAAQSVDQRVKMPRWLAEFEKRGGELRICDAGIAELEELARECDLVLVASGKGEIGKLFERDADKSPFDKPMRSLALTYVNGMTPRAEHSAVNFNLIPGMGEYFVFPALTLNGPCEIMVFESLPGGPMDLWDPRASAEEHLETSLHILKRYVPEEYERARNCTLTDQQGWLTGRFPPTVRKPVLTLPSGAKVLGLGDAVCLNDPITGQGRTTPPRARPSISTRSSRTRASRSMPPGCRRPSTAIGTMRSSSSAGPTACCSRRPRTWCSCSVPPRPSRAWPTGSRTISTIRAASSRPSPRPR